MADARVKEVQQWLNDTFPTYFKYDEDGKDSGSFPVKPDGMTGNTTVKALIMAVQIHYNLTPVDGIWGNGTSNACPVINSNVTDEIILKIAQGGFYCKGYDAGGFDGIWGQGLAEAISKFHTDLGLNSSSSMAPEVFKALLNTDPTVLTSKSDINIRYLQQYLNANYYELFKSSLGYISTGGIYDRKTSKAIIYAFQQKIGTTADGALGPNSFAKMPSISAGCTDTDLVKILQGTLACNGYPVGFNGNYDEQVQSQVTEFQKFMLLNLDPFVTLGSVNRRTWCALLWSKGDPDRMPNACDCRTKILDATIASGLYERGFRYIGRYLTNVSGGYDKALTPEEVAILLDAGLKIFPIFQESPSTPKPSDFNKTTGQLDAAKAISAAFSLGLKKNSIIYFAIDCDMTENQVDTYGIPYFDGLHEILEGSKNYYQIGVYGSRNTCQKIQNAYPGTKCFVSNMSTGYSGNLGFRMPEGWAFDQYKEVAGYAIAGTTFDLDYDMASGVDDGVNSVDFPVSGDYIPPYNPIEDGLKTDKPTIGILDLLPAISWLEEKYYECYNINDPTDDQKRVCGRTVCDFLCQYSYTDLKWQFIAPRNEHFIDYINEKYAENENVQLLYPYIYSNSITDEESGDSLNVRPQLVKDGHLGVFELPHLAIGIKCYLVCPVPPEWAAWAGDFASAVQETYTMGNEIGFLNCALSRIGDFEPDTAAAIDSRQFNYYDLIADLDCYALRKMMDTTPSLSECMQEYYTDTEKYDKRYQYFKDLLGFEGWDIGAVTAKLVEYFYDDSNNFLRLFFASKYDNYPGCVEATAIALARNILYWADYTGVV